MQFHICFRWSCCPSINIYLLNTHSVNAVRTWHSIRCSGGITDSVGNTGCALKNPRERSWYVGSFSVWDSCPPWGMGTGSGFAVLRLSHLCCQNWLPVSFCCLGSELEHRRGPWRERNQLAKAVKSKTWRQEGQGSSPGFGIQFWGRGQDSPRLHFIICKMRWKCPPHKSRGWKHRPPTPPQSPPSPGSYLLFDQHLSDEFVPLFLSSWRLVWF